MTTPQDPRLTQGGGYPPGYGPPSSLPPVPELKKQAQTWLIISAISFFFCACGFGIIGVVFCYMAMQAADHGNFADAENKLKWGKITTVIGFVLGAVLSVVGLLHLGQIVRAVMDSLPSP